MDLTEKEKKFLYKFDRTNKIIRETCEIFSNYYRWQYRVDIKAVMCRSIEQSEIN